MSNERKIIVLRLLFAAFSAEQIVECFTHAGVREDEIAQESVVLARLHRHSHGIDHLTRIGSEERAAQYLIGGLSMMALSRPSVSPKVLARGIAITGNFLIITSSPCLRASSSLIPMRANGGSMNTE